MASFKKAASDSPEPPHPFRTFSPSSEPPKSTGYFQLKHEEALLLDLFKAIQANDIEKIRDILPKCGDIDFIFSEVRPLVYAASLGQLDTVELFAERGANLRLPGRLPIFVLEKEICYSEHEAELSPLEAAERHSHDHVAEFLKRKIK